jgi:hypothetical protein
MLNFDQPIELISTLQKEVNINFRDNRLPINCQLQLRHPEDKRLLDSYADWEEGRHEILLTANNNKKTVATIYSYRINNQQWFRYYIPPHSRFTPKETMLLQTAIREVFTDSNLNGCETNIAQVNHAPKIKKYNSPFAINAEWIWLPTTITYFVYLFFNQSLLLPMLLFVLPVFFILSVTYFVE